jgi:hypothetical protein
MATAARKYDLYSDAFRADIYSLVALPVAWDA